jgi:hypothetical protein
MQLLIGKTQDREISYNHPMTIQNVTTRGLAGNTYQAQLAAQAIQKGASVVYIECELTVTPFRLFQAAKDAKLPADLEIMQHLGQSYPELSKVIGGATRWFGPSREKTAEQKKAQQLNALLVALCGLIEKEARLDKPLVLFLNNVGGTLGALPDCVQTMISTAKEKNISVVISEHHIEDADTEVMETADCKIYQYASCATALDFFHEDGQKVNASMDIFKPEAMICFGQIKDTNSGSLLFEEACLSLGLNPTKKNHQKAA